MCVCLCCGHVNHSQCCPEVSSLVIVRAALSSSFLLVVSLEKDVELLEFHQLRLLLAPECSLTLDPVCGKR